MTRLDERIEPLLRVRAAWGALAAGIGLTIIGIEAIRTVDAGQATLQAVRFAVALGLVVPLCMVPRARVVGLAAYPMLVLSIMLLVFVVLPFVPEAIVPRVNLTTAWINLRVLRLQPSEPAKLTFVLACAWYLRHRASFRTLPGLVVPFAIAAVPVLLILRQPDLGTAMLFGPALLIMLVAAGARLKHILSLLAIAAVGVALVVLSIYRAPAVADRLLKPHQQVRFKALISKASGDDRYDSTYGYQQAKSMQLIGAGQLRGCGREHAARLVSANVLPEAHNDMIFAVITNRWGLIGALVVLGLSLLVSLCLTVIAARSRDPFARLAVVGFSGMLFTQAVINIAVNIGLLPVTGITLPFVSYGGSSLLTTYAMIGLAINFESGPPHVPARPSFEFASA